MRFILLLLVCITCSAKDITHYRSLALSKNLQNDHYWLLLLHVNKNNTSEIDDPKFFLAQNGKHSPKDELLANIKALLEEKNQNDNSYTCRFVARADYLAKSLNLPKIKRDNCKKYNKLINYLDPKSATLVFSSAHINSPASMFGHTFLRIDSSFNSKLLSYAINYAAILDESQENGFLYAYKGVFGGYEGKYSLMPYYDKLKEYNDTEQRDIWEYNLNLTQKEVMLMMNHMWELKDMHSDYFFFDENCSYNILWLLQVARPKARPKDYFDFHVLPPETIFATLNEGLVQNITYRPSKRTKLLALEKTLNNDEAQDIISLSLGIQNPSQTAQKTSYSKASKQKILEGASELSEYYYIKEKINKQEYITISHELDKARARILGRGEELAITPPLSPDKGHNSAQFSARSEHNENGAKQLFGARLAYHDITDSRVGFLRGTQIKALDTEFGWDEDDLELEKLELINIASYPIRSKLFSPFSWRTKFGWNKEYKDTGLHFNANIGAGVTYGNELGYMYTLLEPSFYDDTEPRTALSPVLGFVFDSSHILGFNAELQQRFYDSGEEQFICKTTSSFYISRNLKAELKYDYIERIAQDDKKISLGFKYFF